MSEYLGYVERDSPNVVDWNSLSGQINEKLKTAINTRSNERDAFAQTRKRNEDAINSYELGQNQRMNNLVLDFANEGRSLMYEWNKAADRGEMTRAEYNLRQNNLKDYQSSLANSAKTFDERSMKTLERQQPDENGNTAGSGFELWNNRDYSEIANLKNKKTYINPETGVVYLAEYDEAGNIISQRDVREMNNPGNMMDNRVNVSAAVQNGTKNWKDWTTFTEIGQGGTRTITDARANLAFEDAKNRLIGSVLANARSQASVLVDNSDGDYEFYASEKERDSKIELALDNARAVAKEAGLVLDEDMFREEKMKTMILAERDETGVVQPIITPEQLKAARGYVSDEIEMQIGRSEKGTSKSTPKYYSGGVVTTTTTGDGDLYPTLIKAWKTGGADGAATLSAKTGDDTYFKWEKGGLQTYKYKVVEIKDDKGDGTGQYKNIGVKMGYPIKNIMDLSSYFYGETDAKGQGNAEAQMKAERERYNASAVPKKGDVVDGHRFAGGDPNDQKNWKKV